jgi:hypothetical protein
MELIAKAGYEWLENGCVEWLHKIDQFERIEKLFIYEDGEECPECGQLEYHSGEYPCPVCDRPTVWDDSEESVVKDVQ